ncbi:unnamed protein product [Musa textilis]
MRIFGRAATAIRSITMRRGQHRRLLNQPPMLRQLQGLQWSYADRSPEEQAPMTRTKLVATSEVRSRKLRRPKQRLLQALTVQMQKRGKKQNRKIWFEKQDLGRSASSSKGGHLLRALTPVMRKII